MEMIQVSPLYLQGSVYIYIYKIAINHIYQIPS